MLNRQGLGFAWQPLAGAKWLFVGWAISEIVAFVALVHVLGLGGTILLGILTSVLGVVMLRRLGLDATRSLRRAIDGGQPPDGALLDGMLAALGAVLLILPGFVANFVGLALASPSVRHKAAQTFNGRIGQEQKTVRRRPGPTDVIDLTPQDWRTVDRP